ncbi:hypothetical protein [Sporosarcina jiandibaonis]|uniref:hypothetical protein n=1 Tax=Sporosarcina jiandibaonis TaxID=2715535 RepID=UPI0015550CB2|nr:hypothetical protein [Sporosarcina jiandibaonis]
MSLFGYPAAILHRKAIVDDWGRSAGFDEVPLSAKVVEEQKLIKSSKVENVQGEMVHSSIEVHLEGPHLVTMLDEFVYVTNLAQVIKFRPVHFEVKKHIGTDDVKKVIVYG